MTAVQEIEEAVRDLPAEDLRQFRNWFADYDAKLWDAEFERDASTGALDSLADEALRDQGEGLTRPL